MTRTWGGIEAGGTRFVCAVGSGPDGLEAETTFPTTTPEETLPRAVDFLRDNSGARLAAVGIGSFGPLDLREDSPAYGRVTSTPKLAWEGADLVGAVSDALGVPVALDTDANAAALGERRWGAAIGVDDFVYLTVGTGIGGGAMTNGRLVHGLVHPEMGHARIPHDRSADDFDGVCPYHGDCLEGLASGPAIERRWGQRPDLLPDDHPAWDLEAGYLAAGVANLAFTLSPRLVVMGGGVMKRPSLLPRIRDGVRDLLGGYVRAPEASDAIDDYIVAPALGERSGVLGAIALAQGSSGIVDSG